MLSIAVSVFSQMAAAVTIPCNTDGVVHNLKFNEEISTPQGKFYSFLGKVKDKRVHVLYPSAIDQKISLSVLRDGEATPAMKIFQSGERSLKLDQESFSVICTNPEAYNPKFMSEVEQEGQKLQQNALEEVDGGFIKTINTKYKKRMIDKLIEDAKKSGSVDEQKLREQLDKYLIATGVNYENKAKKKIGTFSISWGYHRDYYAQSDVRIWNEKTGTDFMAYDVDAVDSPGFDQIVPKPHQMYYLDVPQYQVRIAYMLPNGKWGVELSQEHLKYKMKQRDDDFNLIGQDKHVVGNYFGEEVDGIKTIGLDEEFYFEHTDGLNPMSVNIIRNVNVTAGKFGSLDVQGTVGAGIILPATMSVIKGQLRDDKFSIVGYDTSLAGRIRYTYGSVYLQAGAKFHHIEVVKGKLAGDNHLHQFINAGVFGVDFGININSGQKAKRKAL